jgi:TRAP transporter 4TM/12TM fusion protein
MKKSEKLQSAEEVLKWEQGELRQFRPLEKYLVSVIAIAWASFQLSLASFLILDSIMVRAIHLAFAMVLGFLILPWRRHAETIPIYDYLLAIIGLISALYIVWDWEGIAMRSGAPSSRDVVLGIIIVIVLLEAARRSIGPALSIIVIVFTAYAFLGPYMPELIAFKGVSLTKYLSQVSLSSEGIYGIPLGVSASIVYLFVLLGAMFQQAGAGQFFIDLSLAVLGRFKGGPAKAAVVASGFTGLVSGSSIANIVTTGTFTIPLMKKVGYPAKKAAATEVAASTDGQLMPPIMGAAAFIIAEYVNVPYIQVVKAALIPAFVSYCALFFITHLEASKLGMRGLTREETPRISQVLKDGFHFLIPLAVLIVELIVLRHSPEKAAFRAIVALVIIILFQEIKRALKDRTSIKFALAKSIRLLADGCIAGSKNMIPVALACAAAGIIVGTINMGIGGMITQIVEQLAHGNIFLLLIITAIASLLLGMGLPTTATYIVMASLTAPIIVQVSGIYGFFVPLMAAHLFCFYFGILADDTPPVGLAAYTAAAIAKSDPIRTGIQSFIYDMRTAIIPFMFVFNPHLILYGIDSWLSGLLIFTMAALAACSFTSAVQGWFLIKNKWYEVPFFLAAALILFHPGSINSIFKLDSLHPFVFYPIGVALLAMLYGEQKLRHQQM